MPDNRHITVYRKDWEQPFDYLVRSAKVSMIGPKGIPQRITFEGEDGRTGDLYINPDNVDAVSITPGGDPSR